MLRITPCLSRAYGRTVNGTQKAGSCVFCDLKQKATHCHSLICAKLVLKHNTTGWFGNNKYGLDLKIKLNSTSKTCFPLNLNFSR